MAAGNVIHRDDHQPEPNVRVADSHPTGRTGAAGDARPDLLEDTAARVLPAVCPCAGVWCVHQLRGVNLRILRLPVQRRDGGTLERVRAVVRTCFSGGLTVAALLVISSPAKGDNIYRVVLDEDDVPFVARMRITR